MIAVELLEKYFEAKRKYFEEIFKDCDLTNVKVWNEGYSAWISLSKNNLEDQLIKRLEISRSILQNEIVFDIDGTSWEKVRELADSLLKILEHFNIPYNLWTSGRWLHVHVFIKDKGDKTFEDFILMVKYYFKNIKKVEIITLEDVQNFQLKMLKEFALFICDCLAQNEDAHIDTLKITSSNALIRVEGSLNRKTGYFKSYLKELPIEQPKIRFEDVIFPEKVKFWEISNNYHDIFYFAFERLIERAQFKKIKKSKGKAKTLREKYKWIEELLNVPLSDGRKRAINLIFAPYFTNILGLDFETATKKIFDWLEKCEKLRHLKINEKYVNYQLGYSQKRGLLPLSLKNAILILGDVPEFVEFIEKYSKNKEGD